MILVVDVETTGLDPATDSIVELAFVSMSDEGKIQKTFCSLVKPPGAIPPVASGIHHITDTMVRDAPSLTKALLLASKTLGTDKPVCYVAHNAAFDSAFLPALLPWACTWRLASHLWPEAPGHSNMTLRYWLPGLNDELLDGDPEPMRLPAHRALPDVWATAHILRRMLQAHSIKRLMALSLKPILLHTVRFGKHRGEPWDRVPSDYLSWIVGQKFDRDVIHTARHYLDKRG